MARPKQIDRDALLDVAEKCVSDNGAASLSFGSLAASAGLSKGTVQTVFGTRDNLLEALLGRWIEREEIRFDSELAGYSGKEQHVLAHLKTTEAESVEVGRTVLTMLAALAGNGSTSDIMRNWYRTRLLDLKADDDQSRRFRIAYLAAEGAFLVRNLIGLDIPEQRWSEIFTDLHRLVDTQRGC